MASSIKEPVGYVCATAIVIVALLTDGTVALGLAGMVAGTIIGLKLGSTQNSKPA